MTEIVPHGHKDAKGTDICGMTSWQYIIRPDLGYYMRAYRLRDEKTQLEVYPLHPSCSKGDHYLATTEGYVYIINGSQCRVVSGGATALRDDNDPEVFELDTRCQGGDFYLAKTRENFYIIFADRGKYLEVSSLWSKPPPRLNPIAVGAAVGMPFGLVGVAAGAGIGGAIALAQSKPEPELEYKPLHDDCKGGLYYFATEGWFYVLKQVHPKWGLQYLRTRDLSTNAKSSTFSIHPNVAKFLPGGLALTMGRTFARWEKLGSFSNNSQEPVHFNDEYTHKVGYKKEKRSEIEHSWKVETSVTYNVGNPLTQSLFKAQVSGTAGYGGHHISTETEDWTEESITKRKFNVKVDPGKSIYAWQLKIGLGDQEVLCCKDIKYTDNPDPPELPAGAN